MNFRAKDVGFGLLTTPVRMVTFMGMSKTKLDELERLCDEADEIAADYGEAGDKDGADAAQDIVIDVDDLRWLISQARERDELERRVDRLEGALRIYASPPITNDRREAWPAKYARDALAEALDPDQF